jgi:hypothetical protein
MLNVTQLASSVSMDINCDLKGKKFKALVCKCKLPAAHISIFSLLTSNLLNH